MGTVIEHVAVARPGWRDRHSALRLAVAAARDCLGRAGCDASELDLVVNVGIYRDRNMGEPALAALIQNDIGANPEDPHPGGHGTFSFDVANGTCGVLTALQIVDGFLRAQTIHRALIVASDADPGRGMSEAFPFSPTGAALLCGWGAEGSGIGRPVWVNAEGRPPSALTATVGYTDARNVLRVATTPDIDERFAEAAAEATRDCLAANSIDLSQVDAIVTAPARPGYRVALAQRLGLAADRIDIADDSGTHTAALAGALVPALQRLPAGAQALLVAAGAGVTAGAALYRQPPTGAGGAARPRREG